MKTIGKIVTVVDFFESMKTAITNSFKEVSKMAIDPYYCGCRFYNLGIR